MALALPADLELPAPSLPREALLAAKRALLEKVEQDEVDRARLYARTAQHRAEVARLWGGLRPGSGLMELAGTARIGQHRAARQVEDAVRLTQLFPRATALLTEGLLWQGGAEMLLSMSKRLSAEQQLALDVRVSDQVVGLDAQDARHLIGTAIAELSDRERHERARAQRGVWVKPIEDGMARIGAETDQVTGRRFALDLEELVRAEKRLDDRTGRRRTTQQRRADVLAELPSRHLHLLQALQQGEVEQLLREAGGPEHDVVSAWASLPVRNPVVIYVHTPMTTLLDLDNRCGFVEGLGALPAHQVRLLRPVASLARLVVDQATGVPIGVDRDVDPPPEPGPEVAAQVRGRLLAMIRPVVVADEADPRHDPSPRLRRLVELRDVSCDGPGCAVPARACELDHDTPYADEGPTGVWNLVARSPRCHHGKHAGWSVVRHGDGSSTWTSPSGRTYDRRARWRRPPRPSWDAPALQPPQPDALDDTDPREDWHLPLWRAEDPPGF